jgi:hypothetical protein
MIKRNVVIQSGIEGFTGHLWNILSSRMKAQEVEAV